MSTISKTPATPVSGKYTFYVDRTSEGAKKRERLSRLFSGNENISPPFVATTPEGAREEAKQYFGILHSEIVNVSVADPAFANDVDMTYKNRNGDVSPPGNTLPDETLNAPGGPMNRFVPNLKSPGPGGDGVVRVQGTDLIENPKLEPNQVVGAENLSLENNINLEQPANQDTRITI